MRDAPHRGLAFESYRAALDREEHAARDSARQPLDAPHQFALRREAGQRLTFMRHS
jgi:hypothetical protein